MKGFIGGIVTMILVLVLGLVFALMGFVNVRADNPPSKIESTLTGHAMDASVARGAPKLTNPVAADEASLVAGAHLYRDHCTVCHGDPAHPKSPLADSGIAGAQPLRAGATLRMYSSVFNLPRSFCDSLATQLFPLPQRLTPRRSRDKYL